MKRIVGRRDAISFYEAGMDRTLSADIEENLRIFQGSIRRMKGRGWFDRRGQTGHSWLCVGRSGGHRCCGRHHLRRR